MLHPMDKCNTYHLPKRARGSELFYLFMDSEHYTLGSRHIHLAQHQQNLETTVTSDNSYGKLRLVTF